MAYVLEEILVPLLKKGIYINGQPNTTSYAEYAYSVNPDLKQIIITIKTADLNVFDGSTEFDKARSKNQNLNYLVEDFQLQQLAREGLLEAKHYSIDKNNHTIAINFDGYYKLIGKNKFIDLLRITTIIFTLNSPKLHEVAKEIEAIMINKKNPPFNVLPISNDRSAYALYADGGSSEILAQQLRKSYRKAALTILNQPGEIPKNPATDKELPDTEQTVMNGSLPATFKKYITISKYLFDLLIKESSKFKIELPKEEVLPKKQKKPTREVKFNEETDEDEEKATVYHADELQVEELVTKLEQDKKVKLDVGKRKSFVASAQERLSKIVESDPDGISWEQMIKSGLTADMEDILPEGKKITLENKYDVCKKLETFFLNTEKIKSLKMINFLFVSLLEFKDDINIHKHETYDYVLFKKNTDSWQKLVKSIRKRAFELLEEEASKIKDDFEAANMLREQCKKDIFKLHRSNAFFLKIGRTSTVKKIDDLIAEREKSYVNKEKRGVLA